jgi:hypothetical protein
MRRDAAGSGSTCRQDAEQAQPNSWGRQLLASEVGGAKTAPSVDLGDLVCTEVLGVEVTRASFGIDAVRTSLVGLRLLTLGRIV